MSADGSRSPFSMPPHEFVTRLPPMAFVLYAYLDGVQGANGHPVKGYRRAARALGWDVHSVRRWAEWLKEHGLVELGGESRQARTMTIVHNPSRGRVAEGVRLPPEPAQVRDAVAQFATPSARRKRAEVRDAVTHQLCDESAQSARRRHPLPSSSSKERSERSEELAPRGSGDDALRVDESDPEQRPFDLDDDDRHLLGRDPKQFRR